MKSPKAASHKQHAAGHKRNQGIHRPDHIGWKGHSYVHPASRSLRTGSDRPKQKKLCP